MSGFQKTSEFSEVKDYSNEDIESKGTFANSPHSDTTDNGHLLGEREPEIRPLSLNPMDWYRDIKSEYEQFTWAMTEKKRVLLRAIFGEGLCTFLFLFTVMAASVNNGRQESPENLVVGAVCVGFCSIAYIYSFADVSGAHFNPAVTFGTIIMGKVSVKKGLAFIGVQIFASILATIWVMAVFPKHLPTGITVSNALVVNLDANTKLVNAFFMEVTLSFILVYVIFATAFDTVDTNPVKVDGGKGAVGNNLTIYTTSGNSKAGFAPIAIGFTLGFLGLLGGSVSGGCFNPARAFGPAIVADSWDNHWIYWIGDFAGAALAGWTQSFFAHKPTHKSAAAPTNKSRE
ncbi:hypothetical protein HDU92_001183 [Lobulomyces angularis]|nr:hypothetical protein HDU92_001183 [Lobulomyces angularis]